MDILQKQKKLIDDLYPDTYDDQIVSTNNMVLAMVGELSELMDGYKALPWKKHEVRRGYILEEAVDLLHFVLELFIIWGINSFEEVEKLYEQKLNKNRERGRVHEGPSN